VAGDVDASLDRALGVVKNEVKQIARKPSRGKELKR